MPAGKGGLKVAVLGPPQAYWGERALAFKTRKSLALVCYLALQERAVPRDELTELLWVPGQFANLRWELHQLRRLPGAEAWLCVDKDVSITCETDLRLFASAVSAGRFETALSLYRGEPEKVLLASLQPKGAAAFLDWLEVERARANTLLRDALRGQAADLETRGDVPGALDHYLELLRHDPLDESAHRQVMRLELRRGDLQAALRQFESCRRTLADELGVAPLPETLELAAELERAALLPAPGARIRLVQRIPPKLLRPPALVGREREWAALEAAWAQHQIVCVEGLAGVGKSRLIMDFVQAKVGDDFAVLHGRPGDDRVPFSTIARGFRIVCAKHPELRASYDVWVRRELARFLPDIFSEQPPPLTDDAGRARFSEAFQRFMLAMFGRCSAYVADDVQFFDAGTFREAGRVLPQLVQQGRSMRTGRLLMAFRSDELPAEELRHFRWLAEAGLATYLELKPLGVDAIAEMLRSLDLSAERHQARALHRRTGGNPLYLVELLKALHEQSGLDGGVDLLVEVAAPQRIKLVINRRLDGLPEDERRLLQVLAALQPDVTPSLLEAVLATTSVELSGRLAALERAQIINGLAFCHDLLHESVVESTPLSVRKLLHQHIAGVLQARGAEPALVAHHWELAGESALALPWRFAAAETAQAQGSAAQARIWFEKVVRAAEPGSELHQRATRALTAVAGMAEGARAGHRPR